MAEYFLPSLAKVKGNACDSLEVVDQKIMVAMETMDSLRSDHERLREQMTTSSPQTTISTKPLSEIVEKLLQDAVALSDALRCDDSDDYHLFDDRAAALVTDVKALMSDIPTDVDIENFSSMNGRVRIAMKRLIGDRDELIKDIKSKAL